eukprot:gene6544-biopygen5556
MRLWMETLGSYFGNDIRTRSAGKLGDKRYPDAVVTSIG